MNAVVPQAWVIQEKKRREEERRRRESENDSVPISLPKDHETEDEYFEQQPRGSDAPSKSTVIIIDI